MKTWLPLILSLHAFPAVAGGCGGHDVSPYCDLVQPVALIGEEDRRTPEEFAEEQGLGLGAIKAAFGASGTLFCGSGAYSAQVTGAADVVTTAGHAFIDPLGSCGALKKNLKACYFHRPQAPDQRYYIDPETLRTGLEFGCYAEDMYYDWAVVRLRRPVREVTPYALPSADPDFGGAGPEQTFATPILMASSIDPDDRAKLKIQLCAIRAYFPRAGLPLLTDCDTNDGSSGAAQFLVSADGNSLNLKELVLTSIHIAHSGKAGNADPFDIDTQYNVSVPVELDFLAAIKELAGE